MQVYVENMKKKKIQRIKRQNYNSNQNSDRGS